MILERKTPGSHTVYRPNLAKRKRMKDLLQIGEKDYLRQVSKN
jgi:hypothetical protein